ncbi:MAG: hypothetical protein DHS20C17_21610 [Cyclobacteriaceae bacterium]|nr:MAG: hypothetical protein DHS20C17_21610 [Cyclobacteriaceae bacterium]
MITNLRSKKVYRTLGNILFLVIYSYLADLLAYTFYQSKFIWSFSPRHYLETIVSVLLMIELFGLVGRFIDQRFTWAEKTGLRFILLSVLALLFSAIITPLVSILFSLFVDNTATIGSEITFQITNNWGLCFIILAFDLIMSLFKKWRASILEVERFKKESIEFRFETLKNQVNPHFLFNSLNTLSSLMHIDLEAADKYLRQLAKVYRYILENRDKEVISLNTELSILQSYIYLVQMRFKDKLNICIDIEEDKKSSGIPPMTLQMLIENAIKHNEVSKKHPLNIDIFTKHGDYLVIRNKVKLKSSKEFSTKVGLDNIISRYRYLSDKEVIVDDSQHVFVVSLPLLAPEEIGDTALNHESTNR